MSLWSQVSNTVYPPSQPLRKTRRCGLTKPKLLMTEVASVRGHFLLYSHHLPLNEIAVVPMGGDVLTPETMIRCWGKRPRGEKDRAIRGPGHCGDAGLPVCGLPNFTRFSGELSLYAHFLLPFAPSNATARRTEGNCE